MKRLNQVGSLHLAAFLFLAVLVAIGLIGYKVATTGKAVSSSSAVVVPSSTSDISTAADVKNANAALQGTAIDSSLDPSLLDQDLNALL